MPFFAFFSVSNLNDLVFLFFKYIYYLYYNYLTFKKTNNLLVTAIVVCAISLSFFFVFVFCFENTKCFAFVAVREHMQEVSVTVQIINLTPSFSELAFFIFFSFYFAISFERLQKPTIVNLHELTPHT